jgi:hypothetical protein
LQAAGQLRWGCVVWFVGSEGGEGCHLPEALRQLADVLRHVRILQDCSAKAVLQDSCAGGVPSGSLELKGKWAATPLRPSARRS